MADTDSKQVPRKRAATDSDADDHNGGSNKRARSLSSSNPQSSFAGWNRGVRSQIRPSLGGRPRLGSRQQSAALAAGGRAADIAPLTTMTDIQQPASAGTVGDRLEAAGHTARPQRSASPSSQLRQWSGADEASKARASVEPVVQPHAPVPAQSDGGEEEGSSSEEGEIRSAFSGDDEAVVINLSNGNSGAPHADDGGESELESGEISEDPGPTATALDGAGDEDEDDNNDGSEDMDVSDDDSAASSAAEAQAKAKNGVTATDLEDEEDPLLKYASGQPVKRPHPTSVAAASQRPTRTDMTLGDLDYEELRLQLRYYHINQNPRNIPLSTATRCLVCATAGHTSKYCATLRCRHCGRSSDDHFSEDCPRIPTCATCQQRGHAQADCAFKLQPQADELACELCGCRQHSDADCESRWRTSRFPPAEALPALSVRLYCYECGDAGHLGNDCGGRPAAKGCGTSMWSRRTVAGGVVPAANRDHDRAPPPLSKRKQRALEERQRRDQDDGEGSLVGEGRVIETTGSRQAPVIKMGSLARNRPDLRGPPRNQPGPPPASSGGKKNKKRKTNHGAQPVRPMPSSAKRAFVRGR